uniref:ELMO domain-containing protein n=1 Tax=Meloidogyne floridensis TaxID=298350 RepID=A0A915P5W4_9BILA
ALGNEFGSFNSSNSTELPSNEFCDQQTIQQREDWLMFRKMLNTHIIMRTTVLPQILVHLTEMLVGILGICSDSSSVARRFGLSKVPRFFRLVLHLERPFYDLFRILVELFCRTWKDMNAKFDEINKVYNVVQDQFERSLFENQNSLEQSTCKSNEFGSFNSSNSTELPSNEFCDQQTIQQKEDWLMFGKMVQKTPPGLLAICAIIESTQTKPSSSKENQLEEELNCDQTARQSSIIVNFHENVEAFIKPAGVG